MPSFEGFCVCYNAVACDIKGRWYLAGCHLPFVSQVNIMKGYGIYVKNDLLEPKHYKAMGGAVWLYLWLLDHVTSVNEQREGRVLGGKPIKLKEIDLGFSPNSYTRYINRLEEAGYIKTLRTPYGHIFTLYKTVKIFSNRENRKNGESIENRNFGEYKEDNTAIDKTILPETSSGRSKPSLLLNNPKAMWNRKNNDPDELVIDADGDGSPAPPPKKSTRKYPNAPAVRKVFQEVLGINETYWKVNPAILQACERLSTERGLDKIKSALEYYKEHRDDKFCPNVSTPKKLEERYRDLSAYKMKKS
jgi:hypothetical protein